MFCWCFLDVRRTHVRALCHREVVGSEGHLPLHKRAAAQQEACAQQPCPVPHPEPFLRVELCVICGSLQRPRSLPSRQMGCSEETGCTESKQLQVVMSSRAIATKPPNATHSRTSVRSQALRGYERRRIDGYLHVQMLQSTLRRNPDEVVGARVVLYC